MPLLDLSHFPTKTNVIDKAIFCESELFFLDCYIIKQSMLNLLYLPSSLGSWVLVENEGTLSEWHCPFSST